MDSDNVESDVLVVGAGPIGLYTALQLTKIGFSVRIIDKIKDRSFNKNKTFLWSPRSLQLLNGVGVSEAMLQDGFRHWKFETFANNGHGSHAANATHQSYRVWENEVTEFNWSLSYECDKVCEALIKALASHGVLVDYQHELINLDDGNPVYYQQQDQTVVATLQNLKDDTISHWRSRILIGADGKRSFVRHKLGIAQHSQGKSGVFYTLVATVTTNFTGTRMSVVTKGQNAVFIVGHGQKMYFMFEHQPRWSQLTIDDSVPVAKAQRHIKSIMDPYQIEFTKVHSYFSWSAESKSCEEYTVDRRYFLVGGAAQSIEPPGLLSTNLGLEQAQNLCWKLYLHLHQRASPLLLDTYHEESRSKLDDVLAASQAFVQLISNRSPTSSSSSPASISASLDSESDIIHPQEQTYKIQKNRPCLVGETPYQTNLINLGTASNFSLAVSESNTITAAAQMMQHRVDPGAVGSLAQNARLKPYTMIQILLSQSNLCTASSNSKSITADEPPPSPTSIPPSPSPSGSSSSSNNNGSSKKTDGRPRSLSSTPTTASGWSLAKLHIVTKKAMSYYNNGNPDQRTDKPDGTASSSSTLGAPAHATSTSSTSERWKRIRPNYYHLLDRMGWEYSDVTFTILVFCGNIHEDEKCLSTLRKLRRYLDSPTSFIHRYETHHQHHQNRYPLSYSLPKSGSTSTVRPSSPLQSPPSPSISPPVLSSAPPPTEPNHRASISSFSSSHRSSFSYPTTRGSYSAFSIPGSPTSMTTNMTRLSMNDHRPSFSSAYYMDDTDNSAAPSPPHLTEDARATSFSSSNSSNSSSSTPSPLFSFFYVTTSSKNDVIKCLNTTPSTVIHAAFPFGLDKVYLDHDHQCHNAYNSSPTKNKSPTMVVIRPDGYVGARVRLNDDEDVDRLDAYFDSFLRPHYDHTSAAALIAAAYDDDC